MQYNDGNIIFLIFILVCQCGEGDLRVRQDQPTDGEQAYGQENLSTNRTGTP